jgi:hypothetical protein
MTSSSAPAPEGEPGAAPRTTTRAAAIAGPLAALLIGGLAVLVHGGWYRSDQQEFSRFNLPAFDPYVYVAMAEQPQFFTVAPWGYRVLTPGVVHLVGPRNVVRGYRGVMVGGVVVASLLVFLWLRALGHAALPSLLGVAAFAASRPVGECVRSVFVSEPLSVAIELAFLTAVQWGAGLPVLALLLCLMAASKEIWVLLLPLVYLARRREDGTRAAAATLLTALPALVVAVALRWWWAPQIRPDRPQLSLDQTQLAWAWLRATWPETWPVLVLDGITPLAVLGLLHPAGRAFARRYAWLAAPLALLALTAWLYVPARHAMPYFGANTGRLMVYVLPFLVPLALFALDRVRPSWRPPISPPDRRATRLDRLAAVGLVAAVALPFLALDRYRRVPLHERRDGPLVLTVCRETLRAARRLEAGRSIVWDLSGEGYRRGEADPRRMSAMRWYLRDGWGDSPAFSSGPAAMTAAEATILLPCLRPHDLEISLGLDGLPGVRLEVLVNGKPVGTWRPDAPLRVPASGLFRGDNLLTLRGGPGGVRLRSVTYAAAGTNAGP